MIGWKSEDIKGSYRKGRIYLAIEQYKQGKISLVKQPR